MATVVVLGVVLVAWSATPGDASGQHAKWEYKYVKMTSVELIGTNNGTEHSVLQLNRFGEDGWELVSMQPVRDTSGLYNIDVLGTPQGAQATTEREFDCFFKRQK
jgi:hypothetical protein